MSSNHGTADSKIPSWLGRASKHVPMWAVAIGLLGIGVLIGHFVWPDPDKPDHPPAPITVDLGTAGRYVALGDSYSAGEGLLPWVSGTEDTPQGDRCHRSSSLAYPLLLQFVYPTETVFRACSGAVVANVFDEVQNHGDVENSQGLEAEPGVLGPDVVLVTLTMGGNDVDFAKALTFCFEHDGCAQDPYPDAGSPTLSDWLANRIATLSSSLSDLYGGIQTQAPNARVLVLGYPPLFPERAPPIYDLHSVVCKSAFQAFTSSEREFIRDAGVDLNATIASSASTAGVEFVDPTPYFSGHEACGDNGEWIRFVDSVRQGAIRDGSFHPLEVGQQMFARILSCHLFLVDPDTPPSVATDYAMTGCVSNELVKVSPTPALTATPTAAAAPTVSLSP